MAAEEKVKMQKYGIALFAFLAAAVPAAGQQFPKIKHLDLKEVDPALIDDTFGPWEIRDKTGKKRCPVVLNKTKTAGSYAIDIPENCTKLFPVLKSVSGWHLLESWTIDLVDANWQTLVRFSTPDERYVAIPEVDGIETIVKPRTKKTK